MWSVAREICAQYNTDIGCIAFWLWDGLLNPLFEINFVWNCFDVWRTDESVVGCKRLLPGIVLYRFKYSYINRLWILILYYYCNFNKNKYLRLPKSSMNFHKSFEKIYFVFIMPTIFCCDKINIEKDFRPTFWQRQK